MGKFIKDNVFNFLVGHSSIKKLLLKSLYFHVNVENQLFSLLPPTDTFNMEVIVNVV